jgi:hypothetical protein
MTLRVKLETRPTRISVRDEAFHVLEVENISPRAKREAIFALRLVLLMLVHRHLVWPRPDFVRRITNFLQEGRLVA